MQTKHTVLISFLALASLCAPALAAASVNPATLATTYYLADCQAGAAAGCVVGTTTNDGLSAARPKQLAAQLPRLQGGDKVLFAMGGAWTDASMNIYVPSASAANPVTWDSSAPPWGGSAKPILTEARPGRYLFNFSDAGERVADGGYVIRNLDLRGGGVFGGPAGGEAAIFLYFAVNDVLMENLEISGFKLGVYSAHAPKLTNGWENYRITLRNSYLHDNLNASWLGGAADLLIENNVLDHNGSAPVFDHDLYVESATRAVVRNNTITRTVLDSNGKCSGSVIVVHGNVDGLTIEGNKITEPVGSIPQCFGIEVSGGYDDSQPGEYFHDVTIRTNTVVNVGYIGIGARNCARCVIEDNALVWTGKGGSQAISMSVNNPSALDERGGSLTIRNNSIFMQDASDSPGAIRLLDEGTNHTVTSNLIVFGSATSGSANCFDTSVYPIGAFAAFDNNLCFRQGGPAVYSAAYATLAAAKAAGFDVHGLNADPLLVATPSAANGYSMALRSGSPAIGMGSLTTNAVVAASSPGGDSISIPVIPATPTGLSATSTSTSGVNLSWTASLSAISYTVYRSATNSNFTTSIATGVTGTSYSDTGLSASTTYYYEVAGVNSKGEGQSSTSALATTNAVVAASSPGSDSISTPIIPAAPAITAQTASTPSTISPATPERPRTSTVSTPFSFTFTRSLSKGMKGKDVAALQDFLVGRGYLILPPGVAEGYFGALTTRAIISFQKDKGIDPVAIFGPKTRVAFENSASAAPNAPSSPSIVGYAFKRNLTVGMRGGDIRELQVLLNRDPDTRIAPSGSGSPGNETGYFGPKTRAAIERFQRKHSIVSSGSPATTGYGRVGPKTRDAFDVPTP